MPCDVVWTPRELAAIEVDRAALATAEKPFGRSDLAAKPPPFAEQQPAILARRT